MRLLLVLSALATAQVPPPPPEPPRVSYQDHRLVIQVEPEAPTLGTIEWQALPGAKGQKPAVRHGKALNLSAGAQEIALDVGDEAVHRVSLKLGKATHELWTSRAEWGLGPESVEPESPRRPQPSGLIDLGDLMLSRGVFARLPRAPERDPFEVGRALVRAEDPPIGLGDMKALVLIARGTIGPARVTLTDRGPKGQTRYYDEAILLTPNYRRYVIPLDAFVPRETTGKLSGIARVSLHSLEHLGSGAEVEIDYLGLSKRSPRVAVKKRMGEKVELVVSGMLPNTRVRTDDGGAGPKADLPPDARGSALVSSAIARRFWACWGEGEGHGACDPPDAPATAYALPPPDGLPRILDDFSSGVPVSADRRPTQIFTSSTSLQFDAVHRGGTLALSFVPRRPGEYIGYSLPLSEIPAWAKTIELRVKGSAAPRDVLLGLRDTSKREPKVRLGNYVDAWGPDWTDLRIPVVAIKAALAGFNVDKPLGPLQALTITLQPAALGKKAELELDLIRLTAESLPVVVTSFDADPPGQTAFGGALKLSASGGLTISSTRTAGKHGRGLSLEVSSSGAPGQALLAFGFGHFDVRPYTSIAFEISGLQPDTHAELILADRKRRAKLPLSGRIEAKPGFTTVRIPLQDFDKRLDRSAIAQAFIAFDEKLAGPEHFVIDEVRLE
ncbi:MAG: hypothetical protein U1E65_22985 [Myxococcota bacterium]